MDGWFIEKLYPPGLYSHKSYIAPNNTALGDPPALTGLRMTRISEDVQIPPVLWETSSEVFKKGCASFLQGIMLGPIQ